MSDQEQEFLKSLRATFKVEASEHVQEMAAGLLELEKTPPPDVRQRLVETVFRAAHSLKGAARAVNYTEIESICQSLENTCADWKQQGSVPSPEQMDTLHRLLDETAKKLDASVATSNGGGQSSPLQLPSAAAPLEPTAPSFPSSATDKTHVSETVRITVAKLDAQLLESEEMLVAKLTTSQRAADLRELAKQLEEWNKEWAAVQPEMRLLRPASEGSASNRVIAQQPPRLARLIEFVDWNHDYLRSLESKVVALQRTADQDRMVVGKLVDDLLEGSKKMLMLPLATLCGLFPKLVRDLCRDQGKEADLVIRGEELEIDKRILEEMKDPFIHLLRNCVGHGIETSEQRLKLGKPPRATISLVVLPIDGNKVELLVSDDGAGIDPDKVKESAVRRGLISAEQARVMGDSEALALIFQPDVSTSPIITQLSGRGLGLAIVREKTEKLGGRVSVESRRRAGTTIRITLPIAVATFRGILVEVAKRQFIVPTAQVERVVRFKAADVQTVEGRETLSLNGRAVALVRLSETLALPPDERPDKPAANAPAIILSAGDQRIAFRVDAVLDEQEVLVKRFSKPLSRVRNFVGATVLASGRVAPILNVADLLKSARKGGGVPVPASEPAKSPDAESAAILVVEDSITSRMLLKGVLESAGYKVKTAVDGLEAFTVLRSQHFDLVVSDVEMPRMNGFDLTARIRADKKLGELPVVLVTALETREDRERGIDAGASAYLVKSNFDQNNLLQAIRRLT